MRGGIIGRGRVGSLLASLFREQGIDLVFSTTRATEATVATCSSEKDLNYSAGEPAPELRQLLQIDLPGDSLFILFLTTPDDSLMMVSKEIAAMRSRWERFCIFHCCGGIGPKLLDCFLDKGAEGGVLHPCYAIRAGLRTLPRDKTVCFTYSGTEQGGQIAGEFVARIGASFVRLPQISRELYHAGNVLASGHIVSLIESAHCLLHGAGVSQDDAFKILRSLGSGVINNLFTQSENGENTFQDALTGPFVRGDRKLIAQQRIAIEKSAPAVLPIYDLLGARIEEIANKRRRQ